MKEVVVRAGREGALCWNRTEPSFHRLNETNFVYRSLYIWAIIRGCSQGAKPTRRRRRVFEGERMDPTVPSHDIHISLGHLHSYVSVKAIHGNGYGLCKGWK
jgi:hypothetical protein